MTSYSLESCCPISWKIGWSSAGVAVSTYLPPVRFARLLSVAGSYCGELEADRDDADVRVRRRLEGFGARGVAADVRAVGEEHDGRPLESLILRLVRRR